MRQSLLDGHVKRLTTVLNSDAITRYNTQFSAGALTAHLRDQMEVGQPFLLNHDWTLPLGWVQATILHFEPGLTRLIGQVLIPETSEDQEDLTAIRRAYVRYLAMNHQSEIAKLKRLLASKTSGDEREVCRGCVAIVSDDLARRAVPEAFAEPDRDGLMDLARLVPIGPGVFRFQDLALFAHPYLRRSQSRLNTLNQPLLYQLQRLAGENVSIRLALDPDMVGLVSTYHDYFEYQYWWGPKFSDDLASIPAGVTRHEASEQERLLHAISRSEFWWHRQDDKPTFEVEELRDRPSRLKDQVRFGCRYAHAIVDEETGLVNHFDGAIRAYSEALMIERLDASIDQFGRLSEYTKLWRVNTPISVSEWKRLLSDFFMENHLVGEYLGASLVRPNSGPSDQPEDADPISKLVPYSISRGAGVRVAMSLHPKQPEIEEERQVFPLDTLVYGQHTLHIVESEAVELMKALQRRGGTISLPEHITIVRIQDQYVSLPLILHSAQGSTESVDLTWNALGDLVEEWTNREYDLVATFAIGFPLDAFELRISVFGHVVDIGNWLAHRSSRLPTSIDEVEQWADCISAFLADQYEVASDFDVPELFDVLMPSSVFSIQRVFVDQEETYFQFVPTDKGLEYKLEIPQSKAYLG